MEEKNPNDQISPDLLGIILEKVQFLLTVFIESTQINTRKLLVFGVCLNASLSSEAGEVSALTTFHHRIVFSCYSLNLLKFQHCVLKCLFCQLPECSYLSVILRLFLLFSNSLLFCFSVVNKNTLDGL